MDPKVLAPQEPNLRTIRRQRNRQNKRARREIELPREQLNAGPPRLAIPPPLPAFTEEPGCSNRNRPTNILPYRPVVLPFRPIIEHRPICRVAPFRVVPPRVVPDNPDPVRFLEPPDSPPSSRSSSPTSSTASTLDLEEIGDPEIVTLD
ncbi:mediator of RNA polymerase II transcription subunit 15-like [Temnothorax curvispinosus]|uniref:Mediator of RNA polymerase II transcription subunit 15-like n=1 Tax=Temnothorax curvispinosus TaxID=300111 RepID=A0A6J1Q3T2_9HYME|nr:mediator of RNA polymerase II transcription subunit 15-like [Temnothorax curvispinosus]